MKTITKKLTCFLLVGLIGSACAACGSKENVETSENTALEAQTDEEV